MLSHVLAVLGLAAYAFEVWRTIQRFGARRPGMVGGAARSPIAHVVMAVVLTLIAFIVAASFEAVPLYVAPAAVVINAVYLIFTIRYARRRAAERAARRRGDGEEGRPRGPSAR